LALSGFLSAACGLTALALSSSTQWLFPIFTAIAFGTGILRPTLTSLITRAVDRGEQGVVLGLTQSLYSIGSIAAPLAAGMLIGRGKLAAWALLAAFFSLAGLAINRAESLRRR
jgi:MFS family permease